MNMREKRLLKIVLIIVVTVISVFLFRMILFEWMDGNPIRYMIVIGGVFLLLVVLITILKYKRGDYDKSGDVSSEVRKNLILFGKDNTPEYESRHCPNCGAPVSRSSPEFCQFCRSVITEKGKEPKKPIPKDAYPNRYYDENFTGYRMHDMNHGMPHNNMNGVSREEDEGNL